MNIETYRQERENFKKFSAPLLELKQAGELQSVNQGLMQIYRQHGHTTLKTWQQWKAEGKGIKNGQRPLYFWGSKTHKYHPDGTMTEFFPMIVLYSENQVFTHKNKKQ